jgi:hypothetical protein
MSVKGVTSSTTMPQNDSISHDKIAMRAYEKWCKRGRPQGTDKQDWIEAEAELRAETKKGQSPAMARR